jgi:hypothetical protein
MGDDELYLHARPRDAPSSPTSDLLLQVARPASPGGDALALLCCVHRKKKLIQYDMWDPFVILYWDGFG